MEKEISKHTKSETAIFAAGCFWEVKEMFRKISGVLETFAGYTGGNVANPTYEQVCTGTTNHAEAVKIVYDPSKVKYSVLLKIFWENHNPTTLNRQDPDVGQQYRSAIFYMDDRQKEEALKSKEELGKSGKYKKKIVTQVLPASPFYKAEEYHQKYFMKRNLENCHI